MFRCCYLFSAAVYGEPPRVKQAAVRRPGVVASGRVSPAGERGRGRSAAREPAGRTARSHGQDGGAAKEGPAKLERGTYQTGVPYYQYYLTNNLEVYFIINFFFIQYLANSDAQQGAIALRDQVCHYNYHYSQ